MTTPAAIAKLVRRIKRRPELLLNIHHARGVITRERFRKMTREQATARLNDDTPNAANNTLEYNLQTMDASIDSDRPEWLIYPLVGIEQIRKRRKTARVLSIGPRGEYEIFTLQTIGFRPENIRSLDLFSYSPLTDLGDMHATPYDDASFDVIVLAWVWAYSTNWDALAAELKRIAAPNAVLCISADTPLPRSPDENDPLEGTATVVRSCDDFLGAFGDSVRNIYFRQDADMPDIQGNIVIFDMK